MLSPKPKPFVCFKLGKEVCIILSEGVKCDRMMYKSLTLEKQRMGMEGRG